MYVSLVYCESLWTYLNTLYVSLVVVGDTVDVAVLVHGERHPVQGLGAHHAAEAARVVGVTESLQDLRARTGESCQPVHISI